MIVWINTNNGPFTKVIGNYLALILKDTKEVYKKYMINLILIRILDEDKKTLELLSEDYFNLCYQIIDTVFHY